MSFSDNTNPSPFEIVEARKAQHRASEHQREVANALAQAHAALADAEDLYRQALSGRMKQLHVEGVPGGNDSLAITVCETIAKGEESIALLRKERNRRRGDLKKAEQECFRAAADRRALDGLIDWSMHRDLRTDVPPAEWEKPGALAA